MTLVAVQGSESHAMESVPVQLDQDLVDLLEEVFFIAVGKADGGGAVLGFACNGSINGPKQVRGEVHAVSNGATTIEIEASLAGVAFCKANGFVEIGGEARLTTGRSMECVFMRKDVSAVTP